MADPSCVVSTVPDSGGSVMTRGGFSWYHLWVHPGTITGFDPAIFQEQCLILIRLGMWNSGSGIHEESLKSWPPDPNPIGGLWDGLAWVVQHLSRCQSLDAATLHICQSPRLLSPGPYDSNMVTQGVNRLVLYYPRWLLCFC